MTTWPDAKAVERAARALAEQDGCGDFPCERCDNPNFSGCRINAQVCLQAAISLELRELTEAVLYTVDGKEYAFERLDKAMDDFARSVRAQGERG